MSAKLGVGTPEAKVVDVEPVKLAAQGTDSTLAEAKVKSAASSSHSGVTLRDSSSNCKIQNNVNIRYVANVC